LPTTIRTRLTDRLGLRHPIISAPMAFAAGGRLAAAVSNAGGLGLIGGGYGDATWLTEQFRAAGNAPVGCGFITWSLRKQPALLDQVFAHNPTAVMLSFGDPISLAERIRQRGAKLICQIQTRRDAERALEVGADVIVAQGSEAGGHGEKRGTLCLVPEVADLIRKEGTETLLCAAGGIADGRGLAAALMLGADGVLIGTRLWASAEANVSQRMHEALLQATGDDTIRSQAMDIARQLDWPTRYNARVLRNDFIARWHGRDDELRQNAAVEADKYRRAWAEGDPDNSNTFAGEAAGLIDQILPVEKIIDNIVSDAAARLKSAGSFVAS
jgi:nitronate monooxygenase